METKTGHRHERLVIDIMHTADMIEDILSGLLKERGITHVQYNILRILHGAGPGSLAIGEVKERVMFSNCDMTRMIDRLTAKDMVLRKVCPENRRKVYVSITKKGLDLLNELAPEIRKRLNNFYHSSVSTEEAAQLSMILKRIRNNILQP